MGAWLSKAWDNWLDWFLGTVSVSIFLVGLDNSGKTTLAKALKLYDNEKQYGEVENTTPTVYLNYAEFRKNNIRLKILDWAGKRDYHKYWYESINNDIDVIVYMVDSSDPERFEESRKAFYEVMKHSHPSVPIMVLFNKSDKQDSISHEVIRHHLKLNEEDLPEREVTRQIATFQVSAKHLNNIDKVIKFIAEAAKDEEQEHQRNIRKRFMPPYYDPVRSSLLQQWMQVNTNLEGKLSDTDISTLLDKFQIPFDKKTLKKWIATYGSTNEGKGMNFGQLAACFRDQMNNSVVYSYYTQFEKIIKLKKNNTLKGIPSDALSNFIKTVLHEDDPSACMKAMREKNYLRETHGVELLDAYDLLLFMLSDLNGIVEPKHFQLNTSKMDQPLTNYFINTSHNTFLEDQYTHSVDIYKKVLLEGARCISLVCRDGPSKQPVIGNGKGRIIYFEDVIKCINQWAFKYNPYPVILSLDIHCSREQQDIMATIFQRYFKDKICRPFDEGRDDMPSPAALQYKFILQSQCLSNENSLRLKNIVTKPLEGITALQSSTSKDIDCSKQNPWIMHSWNEQDFSSIIYDKPAMMLQYTTKRLGRVDPSQATFQLSPTTAWSYGVQMAAQNFQNNDNNLRLNRQFFNLNQNCGYILRPPSLQNNIDAQEPPFALSIDVLSGTNLPGLSHSHVPISPYVEVTILSMRHEDHNGFKPGSKIKNNLPTIGRSMTNVVQQNGFNPCWHSKENAPMHFILPYGKDVYFIIFRVYSARNAKKPSTKLDPVICEYITLTQYIRTGLRSIPLYTIEGQCLVGTSLLVRVGMKETTITKVTPDIANDAIVSPCAPKPATNEQENKKQQLEGHIYIESIEATSVPQEITHLVAIFSYNGKSRQTPSATNENHKVALEGVAFSANQNDGQLMTIELNDQDDNTVGNTIKLNIESLQKDSPITQSIQLSNTIILKLTLKADFNISPQFKKPYPTPIAAAITIQQLENLEGENEVYVQLAYLDQIKKTRSLKNSPLPQFGETFTFDMRKPDQPIYAYISYKNKLKMDEMDYVGKIDLREYSNEPVQISIPLSRRQEELVVVENPPLLTVRIDAVDMNQSHDGILRIEDLKINIMDKEEYLLNMTIGDTLFPIDFSSDEPIEFPIKNTIDDMLKMTLTRTDSYSNELYAVRFLPLFKLKPNEPLEQLIHLVPIEYDRGEHTYATIKMKIFEESNQLQIESVTIDNVISSNPEYEDCVSATIHFFGIEQPLELPSITSQNPHWVIQDYMVNIPDIENDDFFNLTLKHTKTGDAMGKTSLSLHQMMYHGSRTFLLTLPKEIESPSVDMKLTLVS